MKSNWLLALILLISSHELRSQEVSLEQILERYFLAGKFEKLQKVQTIILTGSIVQQDLMPVKIVRQRPDKYYMEFDVADMTAYQVYDGQKAWITAPWSGNNAPQVLPPERSVDLKNKADMDGVLYNWKEKGHQAEFTGTDSVEGSPAYKIRVTRRDGGIETLLIGQKDFMLLKRYYKRMAGGKEILVESWFRDYRPVEGIPFAFTVETNNGGRVNELQFETIELNKPIDPKIFSIPEPK